MNPPNPFGSPQGGAFQAPSSSVKPGLFPSFGQQGSSTQPPQSVGFFGQSAFGQPSPHGGNMFVQAPAFGHSQPSTFGPQSSGMSSSGFGDGPTPGLGQDSRPGQGSMFGHTPFGFGQQPSRFGSPVTPAGSQPQSLGFGPSVFGQPTPSSSTSSTSVSTNTSLFGVGQNRGFVSSEFSFKPANEALFKPIFSVSPEPANPQTTSMASSSLGGSQTSSSTTTTSGFSLLSKSGSLGFSFSEPATAPSISSQSTPLTTGSNSGPATTLQFTFSQPATLSSSSTKTATTEPTTPSSFSFKPQTLQPQALPVFGGPVFGQPSALGITKAKEEARTDDKAYAGQGEVGIFARLGKGTKRKDDPAVSNTALEKSPAAEEDVLPEADLPRHPPKRPLMRSRPPGGLFSRALSSLRKDGAKPVKQEGAKEPDREGVQTQGDDLSATPPAAQTLTRGVQEKAEVSGET